MRPACKYVDAGLHEPDVKVLAEIGTEGLPLRRDHAGNRVDFVSLIDRDKVDRVTGLDADQLRIKDEEPVRSVVQFLHPEFFSESRRDQNHPCGNKRALVPSQYLDAPS